MKIETDSFEIDNLRTLARLAKAAYRDSEVAAWATAQNYLVTGLPENAFDTQGVIATQPDTVIVAFRGTEPAQLKDWSVDAQAVRLGAAGLTGTVHIGFVRALDAVWSGIESTVRNHVAGGKKLWITGHSLGGALAVLAACRLSDLHPGVYTFGQPRVGDEAFADTYDSRIGERYFRFINDKDIVARVPPFTAGYRHFGREMQVTPSLMRRIPEWRRQAMRFGWRRGVRQSCRRNCRR
jgi:triacylglycerol lipase